MTALLNLLIRIIFLGGLGALTAVGVYTALPEKIKISVPFTSQAPQGIWVEPWQNACEEASIVMIDYFYNGDNLTKEKAREEILKIFDTKERSFGQSADESMETIAAIINQSNLSWSARVVDNPTIEQMKLELANHRPIMVPIYAPAIDNPYYTDEGPDYHVVVLVGYDDDTQEFIFHDPGTQYGKNFRYDYEGFYKAISDFLSDQNDGPEPVRVIYTNLKQIQQ